MTTRDEVLREFAVDPEKVCGCDECLLHASEQTMQRMADRIAQQDAQIRELEADAKRLDWLQSWLDKRNGFDEDSRIEITHIMCGIDKRRGNFASISRLTDIDSREGDDISGFGEGIRAAIDHAMTPEEG